MAESKRSFLRRTLLVLLVLSLETRWLQPAQAALSPELSQQLSSGKYVYIQSQRKDGSFSKPAEIWFFFHDGDVYVGSRRTTWRAKRIRAGHRGAKIHVQSATGPAFDATGQIITDQAMWKMLFDAYARKYGADWTKYEKDFRDGSADGSRVLIKYSPK